MARCASQECQRLSALFTLFRRSHLRRKRPDKEMAPNGAAPPPFQLIRGDTFNLTLGVVIAVILAACKVPRRQHVTAHPCTSLDLHCTSLCMIHRTLSLDVRLAVRRHAR